MGWTTRPIGRWSATALVAVSALAAACASTQRTVVRPPETQPPAPEGVVKHAPDPTDTPASPADPYEDVHLTAVPGPTVVTPPEPITPTPLDALAHTPEEMTPDEMVRERELAEQAAPVYDIPMVLNDPVLNWLDYYSHRHPKSFEPGLVRSGRYIPMIHEIFAEQGIPLDLAYMAHVESAYKPQAYSRAHAKGVFQFISGTGRRYGLDIDFWVDERSDPEKAARAAAAYLKDLHDEFGDWYLALAGYNAGEGRIRRGLKRTGATDFWGLADARAIKRETRNYVPAILAVILISKDPQKYGFDFVPDPPLAYDTITVDDAVDLRVLARCAGTDVATLKQLNPALRRHQTPPDRAYEARVPVGQGDRTLTALALVPPDERVLYTLHQIAGGDSLWTISRRYDVEIAGIQQANGMGRSTLLRIGRTLKIPTATASSYADVELDSSGSYVVRRGDTLSAIARNYGTSAQRIASANRISTSTTLYPGNKLQIPGAGTATPSPRRSSGGDKVVYTVRRGDTLWRIASHYRTSVRDLCALNSIRADAVIHPGTRLTVRD